MCGHAMPLKGVVVEKFHPVSYGGFFRFSFVLAPVSKALVVGFALQRLNVSLYEFQSKIYLITPDF